MPLPTTGCSGSRCARGIIYVEALPPTGAHYRRTANPPSGDKPVLTVLFLGASKVYGTEVPDDLTLPSLLSKRLSALDPAHGYVVYNAGVQAVTSRRNSRVCNTSWITG